MTTQEQFCAPPPESLGSAAYEEELAFVAKKGARDNADRTEYETLSTPFWNDDLGTSAPPGHWNMIATDPARRNRLSVPDAARLFALLNFAEADAAISCWETKYYYNVWRPETALREIDPALNPKAEIIPDFIPNMPSPPFPAYTSGHSTFSAAGARLLALTSAPTTSSSPSPPTRCPMAGATWWVFVEHGGSYVAPLALAVLLAESPPVRTATAPRVRCSFFAPAK